MPGTQALGITPLVSGAAKIAASAISEAELSFQISVSRSSFPAALGQDHMYPCLVPDWNWGELTPEAPALLHK